MEAGSDNLLYRQRGRPQLGRPLGIALLGLGLLLVALSVGYFLYAAFASSRLGTLEATSSLELPEKFVTVPLSPATTGQEPRSPTTDLVSSPTVGTLYPAQVLRPQGWADPLWAEDPGIGPGPEFLAQYLPVNWDALPPSSTLPSPERIRIPAINLDAEVEGLRILDLGDSRAYETPKFVVGHIPETPSPGGAGNGWYFGHLETLIRGEGAVFRDLPDLAEIVRGGEKVYVIVDNAQGSHLYQITRTWVIPQEELGLTTSPEPTITLVTCVPRLTYDHRFMVEAKLVGFLPTGTS